MTCLCLGLSIGDDLFFELLPVLSRHWQNTIRSSRCNSRKMLIDFLSLCFDAKAIDHCKYQQSQPISTLLSFPQVRLCITLSLLYVSDADGRCFRYPVAAAMVRKLCFLTQTLQDFWLRSCILSGIVP